MEEIACLQKCVGLFRKQGDTNDEVKSLLSLGFSAKSCGKKYNQNSFSIKVLFSKHFFLSGDWSTAVQTYERLLEIALKTKNESLEARTCAHLGIVHHQVNINFFL